MEIILWIVCIIELILLCILMALGFSPAKGTLIIDETDPEDVNFKMTISENVESCRRIMLVIKHKDSRDKK